MRSFFSAYSLKGKHGFEILSKRKDPDRHDWNFRCAVHEHIKFRLLQNKSLDSIRRNLLKVYLRAQTKITFHESYIIFSGNSLLLIFCLFWTLAIINGWLISNNSPLSFQNTEFLGKNKELITRHSDDQP